MTRTNAPVSGSGAVVVEAGVVVPTVEGVAGIVVVSINEAVDGELDDVHAASANANVIVPTQFVRRINLCLRRLLGSSSCGCSAVVGTELPGSNGAQCTGDPEHNFKEHCGT